jgi:hypothetical protein
MTAKVILGIIVFIAFATAPFWLAGTGDPENVPDLQYPTDGSKCVAEKEHMRAFHMDILDDWRNKVVREDIRYTEINGKKVEMSLSKTCLGCHSNKEQFCDRCHNYLDVSPYCWDCHITPKEVKVTQEEIEKGIATKPNLPKDHPHVHASACDHGHGHTVSSGYLPGHEEHSRCCEGHSHGCEGHDHDKEADHEHK